MNTALIIATIMVAAGLQLRDRFVISLEREAAYRDVIYAARHEGEHQALPDVDEATLALRRGRTRPKIWPTSKGPWIAGSMSINSGYALATSMLCST